MKLSVAEASRRVSWTREYPHDCRVHLGAIGEEARCTDNLSEQARDILLRGQV